MDRLYIGQMWSIGLILCETLNFFNVILQVYITEKFLNGRFLELGVNILKYGYEASVDELEVVFPKVSHEPAVFGAFMLTVPNNGKDIFDISA